MVNLKTLLALGAFAVVVAEPSVVCAQDSLAPVPSTRDTPRPPRPRVINDPEWTTPPVPTFPARAQEQGIERGRVQLICGARPDGRLENCLIVSENPVGAGFGREALAAARRAVLSPATLERMADGRHVTFPVTSSR